MRGVGGRRAGLGRGRQAPEDRRRRSGRRHVRGAGGGGRAGRAAARRCRGLVGDALYVGHHRQAEGRAAPPARRARRGAGPCGAESLSLRRADARRHAALSHHGGALAARHVADRRHVRLPAALRRGAGAGADRSREDHQSLSGADALSRPGASRALQANRRQLGAQDRLRRRVDDRRAAQGIAGGVQARAVRQSLRLVGNLHLHHRPERAEQARLRRPRRHQPDGARGAARRIVARRDRQARRGRRDHRAAAGRRILRGLLAAARGRRQGAAPGLVLHRRHRHVSTPTAICSSPAASTT